jgi:hypothetical protein
MRIPSPQDDSNGTADSLIGSYAVGNRRFEYF